MLIVDEDKNTYKIIVHYWFLLEDLDIYFSGEKSASVPNLYLDYLIKTNQITEYYD